MELTQLHHFVMVAEKLYITQPALSRVILRLEKDLGTPLFDRKGGRVTLNRHGAVFLRHVKPALTSINKKTSPPVHFSTSGDIVYSYRLTAV